MATLEETLAEIKKKYGEGGFTDLAHGSSEFTPIINDVKKAAARFRAGLDVSMAPWEKAWTYVSGRAGDLESASGKATEDFVTAMKSIASGGSVKDVGKAVTSMVTMLDKAILVSASTAITLMGDIVGIAADGITLINRKMAMAWGGVEGAFTAFTSTITSGLKTMGGAFGKVGNMLDSVFANAIKGIMFRFEDTLAVTRVRFLETARQGGAAGTPTVMGKEAERIRPSLGRGKTEEVLSGLVEIGAVQNANDERALVNQRKITDSVLQIGITQKIGTGEMLKDFESMQTLAGDNISAAEQLSKTWGAAQSITKDTNLSLKGMAKALTDASMNARFLNVDMRTIANTMNMLKEGEADLRSMGMSLRADGPKILNDWTNASAKATDAMHLFFGTKGGKETGGDMFKGWAASKYGTTFAENLKETGGGGFASKEGKSGDMLVNNLKVMKETMEEAAKAGRTPAEKLILQQKVATDVYKMGAEGAQALAMKDSSKLDELLKNEAVVREFKTEKDYLSKLQTTAVKSENIQRAMASMSLSQLQIALKSVSYLTTIALATVSAATDKEGKGDLAQTLKNATGRLTADALSSTSRMVGDFKQISGVIKGYLGKEESDALYKIFSDIEKTVDILGGGTGQNAEDKAKSQEIGQHVANDVSDMKKTVQDINNSVQKGGGTVLAPKVGGGTVLTHKAKGGSILAGESSWVGEEGPEIFTPSTSGRILSNNDSVEKFFIKMKSLQNFGLGEETAQKLTMMGGSKPDLGSMGSKNAEPMNLASKEINPLGGKGTQIVMNFTGVLDKDKLISMITEASREALLREGGM